MTMTLTTDDTLGTNDLLVTLCTSVTRVLSMATNSQVQYSAVVQRIKKPTSSPILAALYCLTAASLGLGHHQPSADAAMELYRCYLLQYGLEQGRPGQLPTPPTRSATSWGS